MRLLGYLCVVLAAIALAGCDGNGDSGDGGAAWAGPPDPAADGTVAVDGFVEYTDGVEENWESSAAMSAGEFLRLDQRTASRTTIAGTASAEGAGPETVVVTLDGLFDDSVRAERWTLALEQDGDGFRLTSARWEQKCQPGRGHEEFSPEPCS